MSELLEQSVREVLSERAGTLDTRRSITRLSAVDYGARRRPRITWRPSLPTLGVAMALVAAVAAAVLVAVGSFSSTTPVAVAFAGWTARPARASAASVHAALRVCESGNPSLTAHDLLFSEARGPYTTIVWNESGGLSSCISDGHQMVLASRDVTAVSGWIPPNKITVPGGAGENQNQTLNHEISQLSRDKSLTRAQREKAFLKLVRNAPQYELGSVSEWAGLIGSGVTRVSLLLADGTDVRATVRGSWYFLWWPGSNRPGSAAPKTLEVTTAVGTKKVPASLLTGSDCETSNVCLATIYPIQP